MIFKLWLFTSLLFFVHNFLFGLFLIQAYCTCNQNQLNIPFMPIIGHNHHVLLQSGDSGNYLSRSSYSFYRVCIMWEITHQKRLPTPNIALESPLSLFRLHYCSKSMPANVSKIKKKDTFIVCGCDCLLGEKICLFLSSYY